MPINVANDLPAVEVLNRENIFVMTENRAANQDIRPLKILILNIMPTKIATETQLFRMLSNTPLQVDITLLHPATHVSKNTTEQHLESFYKTFDEVRNFKFDGLIITGAPVELVDFEEVNYWQELTEIMDWSVHNVFSTLHICWGAQAGLFWHYGVPKQILPQKMFGIFSHQILENFSPLFRGFDDGFQMPHSRHTECLKEDILQVPELKLLAESEESGAGIVMAHNYRQIFVFGHLEYEARSLADEYERDVAKGLPIALPKHYFIDDDPQKRPQVLWRAYANLFFSNWLNYCVYQETPFNINDID